VNTLARMKEVGAEHEKGTLEVAGSLSSLASDPHVQVLFTMLPQGPTISGM